MSTTVKAIIEAKRKAGEEAWLCVRTTGQCYLYRNRSDSCHSDEQVNLGEWNLDLFEIDQLVETGH